jgi:hypothetical protein
VMADLPMLRCQLDSYLRDRMIACLRWSCFYFPRGYSLLPPRIRNGVIRHGASLRHGAFFLVKDRARQTAFLFDTHYKYFTSFFCQLNYHIKMVPPASELFSLHLCRATSFTIHVRTSIKDWILRRSVYHNPRKWVKLTQITPSDHSNTYQYSSVDSGFSFHRYLDKIWNSGSGKDAWYWPLQRQVSFNWISKRGVQAYDLDNVASNLSAIIAIHAYKTE